MIPATTTRGPRRPVTASWIAAAQASLERSQRTKKEIGAHCGTSGPYISQLLRGRYETSTYIDCISDALGISAPPIALATPELQELVDIAANLDEEMVEQLKVIARSLELLKAKKS